MHGRETPQRELILSVVRSTMDHPTAEWVYRQARQAVPVVPVVGSRSR